MFEKQLGLGRFSEHYASETVCRIPKSPPVGKGLLVGVGLWDMENDGVCCFSINVGSLV